MFVRANIERVIWDSEFFSIPIARLKDINKPDSLLLISDTFIDYKLVQAKVAANDYAALESLQNAGFQIVDGEIDFEIKIVPGWKKNSECLVLATEADISQLKNLAGNAFSLSRFRSPWFSAQDNQRFYSMWAEKAVLGTYDNYCFVIKGLQRTVKGFVTLRHLDNNDVRIGLLAVNPAYRKQGIGEALVNGVIAWCRQNEVRYLRIATQTGNIAALRLYAKRGATIAGSSYWLYRSTQE